MYVGLCENSTNFVIGVAFSAAGVTTEPAKGDEPFKFLKTLSEGNHVACGILDLDPNGGKERKNSSNNTVCFAILEGALDITIQKVSFPLGTGGHFVVPRG